VKPSHQGLHEPEQPESVEILRVVPVRHPGRWIVTALILVGCAMLVHSLVVNPRFQWPVVRQYFVSHSILLGLLRTLELTVIAMSVGIVLGVALAMMRVSPNPIMARASWCYVWFFRGTPLLIQLIGWNFISAIYPRISFGIPFGPSFVGGSANHVITTFVAAILGLGLNEGAYMAEIVRAGLISVDRGQLDAALALGLTRRKAMIGVVLPQALRVIIPPTGNETIGMLKLSSLVSVIALPELLYSAQVIYSRTFQTIPLLIVAGLWYIIVSTILSAGQFYIERHFGRGVAPMAGRPGIGKGMLAGIKQLALPHRKTTA